MDLLQIPFHFLGATIRNNKKEIVELTTNCSLLQDPDKCAAASATLTNPQNRIDAEVGWLPGVTPESASQFLILLESSAGNQQSDNPSTSTVKAQSLAAVLAALPYTDSTTVADKVLEVLKLSRTTHSETDNLDSIQNLLGIDALNPLSHANLLAARISRLPDYTAVDVTGWILEIVRVFEEIKPKDILKTLNRERKIAGFPEIADVSVIEEKIQDRRRYYRRVIRSALEKLSDEERPQIVMAVIDSAVGDTWPLLIEDLVDVYESGIQDFLNTEEKNIETQDTRVREAADAELSDEDFTTTLDKFVQTVEKWDAIAQPIQINRKRQGLDHEDSLRVGKDARRLAIYLYNEHDKLESSQQLIGALQKVFAEIPEIAEQLAEDAEALDKITTAEEELSETLENLKTHIEELQQAGTLADIKKQVEALQEAVDSGNPDYILDSMVRQLVNAIGKWKASTQQIEADYTIMTLLGNVALNLLNEHDKPDLALKIMKVTRDVFPEFLGITDSNRLTTLLSCWDEVKSKLPMKIRYGLLTDETPTVNAAGVVEIPCAHLSLVSDTDRKIIADALTKAVGESVDIELVPQSSDSESIPF